MATTQKVYVKQGFMQFCNFHVTMHWLRGFSKKIVNVDKLMLHIELSDKEKISVVFVILYKPQVVQALQEYRKQPQYSPCSQYGPPPILPKSDNIAHAIHNMAHPLFLPI